MLNKKGEGNGATTLLVVILLAILLFLVFVFGIKSKISGLMP